MCGRIAQENPTIGLETSVTPRPHPAGLLRSLAAGGEARDQPNQARTHARPGREELYEVDRPHVRDGGRVTPDDEEVESQAEAQCWRRPGGGGAVLRGCCPWRRLPAVNSEVPGPG